MCIETLVGGEIRGLQEGYVEELAGFNYGYMQVIGKSYTIIV